MLNPLYRKPTGWSVSGGDWGSCLGAGNPGFAWDPWDAEFASVTTFHTLKMVPHHSCSFAK